MWQEVRQRESKDGEQKLERENTAGGPVWSKEGRRERTDSRLLRISGCVCGQSEPGAAKFNWMSLELRGRTGAAVTVPPHRTGFSVPSEFSSHTPQALDGRPDGRAQTEPIPFRVKVSKVTVVTPPTPDPRPSWSEHRAEMLQTPVFDCPSLVPRLRRCMRPHVKIELTTAHNVYCA